MSSLNFVAIDFETATSMRSSACEVGLTFVENGEIGRSKSWLIQPPGNRFDDYNTYIHGITPSMTADAPGFVEQWEELSSFLKGKTVVAHYAPFDMGVIRDECQANGLAFPDFRFVCSCALSRYVVPGMYSYGLEPLCFLFGIDTSGHHRAEADTVMTAKLMLALCKKAETDSIDNLVDKYQYRFGSFAGDTYTSFVRKNTHRSDLNHFIKEYEADSEGFDDENPFFGKEVVFTGTMALPRQQLMRMVLDIGGRTKDSVTRSTDYLVVGQQDFRIVGQDGMSGKQKKAMQMIAKGAPLQVLSESEFLMMINI